MQQILTSSADNWIAYVSAFAESDTLPPQNSYPSIWAPFAVIVALIVSREILWRRGQTWRSQIIGPTVVMCRFILFLGVLVLAIGGGIALVMTLGQRPGTLCYFVDTAYWILIILAVYQVMYLIVVRGLLGANGFSWGDAANWRTLLPHTIYHLFPGLVDVRRQEYVRLLLHQMAPPESREGAQGYLLATSRYLIRRLVGALRTIFRLKPKSGTPPQQLEQLSRLALIEPVQMSNDTSPPRQLSFLIIGDPGEGDKSQKSLRDAQEKVIRGDPSAGHSGSKALLIRDALASDLPASAREQSTRSVDFVVISSDVIYPAGEMIDYEGNFYIPFRGWNLPILALPGNHDWYDNLRGFAHNFIHDQDPDHPERNHLFRLSRTLYGRAWADSLRKKYGLHHRVGRASETILPGKGSGRGETRAVARQRNIFFEIGLEGVPFSLFVVDTGTGRQIDPMQEEWLKSRMQRARKRKHLIMAILGHPVYVDGRCRREKGIRRLHEILRDCKVHVVMAGDAHNFQHYQVRSKDHVTHHIVNGGGGAFLGSTLSVEPGSLADDVVYPGDEVTLSAVYPRGEQLRSKFRGRLERFFLRVGATTALNHDQDPFYQSFVKACLIRSEVTGSWRLELSLYGKNGRSGNFEKEYPVISIDNP